MSSHEDERVYASMRTPLATVPEAAEQLRLSERSVWRLIAAGRLTPVKFGRSTRLGQAEIDELIARA